MTDIDFVNFRQVADPVRDKDPSVNEIKQYVKDTRALYSRPWKQIGRRKGVGQGISECHR